MANHKSTIKAHKQSLKQQLINSSTRSRLKTLTKKLNLYIEKRLLDEAQKLFISFQADTMRCVRKNLIQLNKASRSISNMNKKIHLLCANINTNQ